MTSPGAAPLRVLQVIDSLGSGGAEVSLATMLPGLASEGIDQTVVVLEHASEGVADTVRAAVDVHRLRSRSRTGRVHELRALLRHDGHDVVHTTLFEASLCGRLAAAGTGVPVLTSLVNDAYGSARYEDPALRPWRLRTIQHVDGWTARHLAAHHHAITAAVKDSAVEQLGLSADTITVIPRGHDPRRFPSDPRHVRDASRRRLGVPEDAELVVHVGRQEYQKGHAVLLEASAALLAERPRLHVMAVGREGNSTAALARQHRQLGLDGRVRFLGYRPDVVDVLAAADVFVFPSLFEGLGNALLEAMAMRLPVVASDLPAIREVTEPDRSALLVVPGDAEDLARTLATLLDDAALRTRLGQRGREVFLERFTLDRVVPRLAALYRQVAGARAPVLAVASADPSSAATPSGGPSSGRSPSPTPRRSPLGGRVR